MTTSTNYQALAKQIISNTFGENVQFVHPIIGKGTVNQVYQVETDNSEYIIRMNESPIALSIYKKEKWCIEQAKIYGVPGPKVLAIGEIDQVAYMIQSKVKGKNGGDSSFDKEIIWKMLGIYTKQFHSIPVNGFGEILADPVNQTFNASTHEGFDGSWHGFIKYNIDCLTEDDPFLSLGVWTKEDSKIVKQKFESLLDTPFSFGLVHGDLSLKNTIVDDMANITVLDWGCAEVHLTPYWELLQLIKSQIDKGNPNTSEFISFLQGYGLSMMEYKEIQPTLEKLLLLDACDKLRWAIDCKPDCISSFAEYTKKVWRRNRVDNEGE